MKKVQLIILIILMSIALLGCEDVKYYESDQFEIISFNTALYVFGYKEGYFSEDLVIYDEVTYFNKRTGKHETDFLLGVWFDAFQNAGLKSITIIASDNSKFRDILSRAFADNEDLTSVVLSPSIEQISIYAFANNPKLESIDLNDLKRLESYAFADCIELKEIKLGSKIISIGDHAFENNHNDLIIYITNPTPPSIGTDIFKGVTNFRIVVPQEYLDIYKTAEGWAEFADHIYPDE